jgi:hypothetical protein
VIAPPATTVVVPTVREQHALAFLERWDEGLADATIILVEDRPEPTFDTGDARVRHVAWCDIEATLGDRAWIIPRGSGCVRSFGCYLAAETDAEMIVALDDDCYPDADEGAFLERHWHRLSEAASPAWTSTLSDGVKPRGVPYYADERSGQAVLNHGLWTHIPDFDAPTQLLASRVPIEAAFDDITVPRGTYFPMCSMNLAWRPEFTPAMYFLLMGPDHAYDRFGDIWGGVLAKRVADHLGLAVNSGSPAIRHERASNVWSNLRKESRGLEVNETFWRAVDSVVLTSDTVAGAYAELADRLPLDDGYFRLLRRAMRQWAELFAPSEVPSAAAAAP